MASPDPVTNLQLFCSSGMESELQPTEATNGLQHVAEDEEEIPVIDFSVLTGGGTPEQRSQAVRELSSACEHWGFFLLVNHGVPERLRKELMDTVEEFFDQTEEQNQDFKDTHVMKPIRYGTSFNAEVDDVKYWRNYLKIMTHPEFHCPTNPPQLREVLHEYARCTRELGRKLLEGIWEGLGLEENYINEELNLDTGFQILVCNLYRPCPQTEQTVGLPPHSDHGLLTILYQNGVDGLDVKHNDKWLRIKPLPNSFLINIGDQMEIATNGKYKSVLHRALVNSRSQRMSIVSVTSPALDTVVLPARQLVTSERPVAFRGMKYRDFMEYQQSNRLMEKSVLDLLRI